MDRMMEYNLQLGLLYCLSGGSHHNHHRESGARENRIMVIRTDWIIMDRKDIQFATVTSHLQCMGGDNADTSPSFTGNFSWRFPLLIFLVRAALDFPTSDNILRFLGLRKFNLLHFLEETIRDVGKNGEAFRPQGSCRKTGKLFGRPSGSI